MHFFYSYKRKNKYWSDHIPFYKNKTTKSEQFYRFLIKCNIVLTRFASIFHDSQLFPTDSNAVKEKI